MAEIARLEELHVARKVAAMAEESRPFAGGIMARGAPGAWFNRAHGAGLSGPVSGTEVEALIRFYSERGIEPRIEVCPFADQSLIDALAGAGFVVQRFVVVMFRSLARGESFADVAPEPPGVRIDRVAPDDEAAIEDFGRGFVSGFEVTGEDRIAETMRAARKIVVAEGSMGVRAVCDGRCVGVAGLEIAGALASLFGAAVAADMRKRGIQLALMAWRLRAAAEAGARVATMESRPGIATERNAMRMGFGVAYSKAVMVRPGEGLVPVAGG
jgi:GNAT superfamily N-acetyltransferase